MRQGVAPRGRSCTFRSGVTTTCERDCRIRRALMARCRRWTAPPRSSGCRSGAGTRATRSRTTAPRLHYEFAKRGAFAKWPLHGNALEMFADGRLEVGPQVVLEPGVWLTAQAPGAHRHRRGLVPEPQRPGRRGRARGDRRALHVRQRLLHHRRQPPLRRPREAGAVAGVHEQGPDAGRRQRVVRRERGDHVAASRWENAA